MSGNQRPWAVVYPIQLKAVDDAESRPYRIGDTPVLDETYALSIKADPGVKHCIEWMSDVRAIAVVEAAAAKAIAAAEDVAAKATATRALLETELANLAARYDQRIGDARLQENQALAFLSKVKADVAAKLRQAQDERDELAAAAAPKRSRGRPRTVKPNDDAGDADPPSSDADQSAAEGGEGE